MVLFPQFPILIFVPFLLEKQYIMGATCHQNLVFEQDCIAEVLNTNFLIRVVFNIGGIDSYGITLSVKAVNLLRLGIVEGFLWEVFRITMSPKIMIHQRLTHLSLIWIIGKMVMHLGLPMKKGVEYLIAVVYEATSGKRLVKARNG